MIAVANPDRTKPDEPRREEARPSSPREEPYEPLLRALYQWWSAAQRYAQARGDLAQVKWKKMLTSIFVGVAAGVAGLIVLITAVSLTLQGIAGGLAEAFGGRVWLGNLTTGTAILAAAGLGFAVWRRSRTKALHMWAVHRTETRAVQSINDRGRT